MGVSITDRKDLGEQKKQKISVESALKVTSDAPNMHNIDNNNSVNDNDEQTASLNTTSLERTPIIASESILLRAMKNHKSSETIKSISPFTKSIKIGSTSAAKKLASSTMSKHTPPNKKEDYDSITDPDFYLDYSVYSDYYGDSSEDYLSAIEVKDSVLFQDFPLEDGYVHMPVFIPGYEIKPIKQIPNIWNAQDSFVKQVVSKMYLLLPAAILGIIAGLVIWIIALFILRTYGVLKRYVMKALKIGVEPEYNVNFNRSADPWINITDAEKIHSINGSMRKSVNKPIQDRENSFAKELKETADLMRTPISDRKQENVKDIHNICDLRALGRRSLKEKRSTSRRMST